MTLNEYLKKNGISQNAFAKKIGTTQAAVCRWCNFTVIPRLPTIKRIMSVTGGQVTPADFYTDE